jgi:argininosuccinate synthase
MAEKIVLAYSGGLDTSVAIRWLKEDRGYDVIALTVDVGMDRTREELESRAMATGAIGYIWSDVQDEFVRDFVFPALKANARYQNMYPLATALSRPLIAREMVAVARAQGATAVAHGCTGKGNDQVRLDVSVQALAPDLMIVAPLREWEMDRESEIEYAQEHNIPINVTKKNPYSIDENLYGRSIETGPLEDPWTEPPADVWAMTGLLRRRPPMLSTSKSASRRAFPSPSTARASAP